MPAGRGTRFIDELYGPSEGPQHLEYPVAGGPVPAADPKHEVRFREPALELTTKHGDRLGGFQVAFGQRRVAR